MDDLANSALFDEASVRFIRTAKLALGDEKAAELMRHVGTFLGEGWSKRLTFSVLAGEYELSKKLKLSKNTQLYTPGDWPYKIQCIKAIRTVSGTGLGYAKAAAERAIAGDPQVVEIHEHAKEFWLDNKLREAMSDIRKAGLFVEIL